MTIRQTKGTPTPGTDVTAAAKKAASNAVANAISLTKQVVKPEVAKDQATDTTAHVDRMRGIKRGGTGPLPWETVEAAAAAPAPALQTGPTKSGPVRRRLSAGVDTTNPNDIRQVEGKNTCAAANKQRAMAEHNPEAYRRMVYEIERTGKFTLPNGEQISLSPANRMWIDNLPNATPEERENMKVQAALMDYANGDESYDMEQDLSMNAEGKTHKGLSAKQAKALDKLDNSTDTAMPEEFQERVSKTRNFFMRMVQALFEQFGYDAPLYTSAVTDATREALKRAQTDQTDFSLAIKWPGGETPTHMVTVTNVDDDGNVTVRDTNGDKTYSDSEWADLLPRTDDTDIGGDTTAATTTGTSTTSTGGTRPPRR